MNQVQLGNAAITVACPNQARIHKVGMRLGWHLAISVNYPNNPYARRLKIQLKDYYLTIKERKKTMSNYIIN